MDPQQIDVTQLYYRGYTDPKCGNDLRQRVQQAARYHPNNGKNYDPTDDFTAGQWRLKISVQKDSKVKLDDWKALDLLKGVVNLPLGANKRHLTLALEHAQTHNKTDLMLKELPAYIKEHGIGKVLPDMVATSGEHSDLVARRAFEAVVASGITAATAAAKTAKTAQVATEADYASSL